MRLNKLLLIVSLHCIYTSAIAQYDQYQGYYKFPIRPGEQNFLSGTMGELRRTHFHGGIDIKTSGVTGLPVYAAADGFISRIKITRGGYGNALYIKHPNGTTTVYAHLKSFKKEIQQYLIKKQYENKSWTVDLFPQREDFPIKKGDIIASSGNSGSSSGPHLHFEVRDKNQYVLDPLRMGFKEIKDQKAPLLKKIAFVTKSPTARINGKFGRMEIDVIPSRNGFTLKQPITLKGPIGIEIYAYDVAEGTRNKYGVPDLKASLDNEVFFTQHIRNIPYGKMRNILVHTNYQNSVRGGRRFNKLFIDDGNTLGIYGQVVKKGIIHFDDNEESILKITLSDPKGNESFFETTINPIGHQNFNNATLIPSKSTRKLDVLDNTLKVLVSDQGNSHLLEIFANNVTYQLPPEYTTTKGSVYMWDLCYGLPDSIDFCNEVKETGYVQSFFPGQSGSFYHPSVDISFKKSTLFDTLYLNYSYQADTLKQSELFHFNNAEDPLKTNAKINLKPKFNYNHKYARVYSVFGKNKTSFIGGNWSGDEIEFNTRDLVKYTIDYDSIAPTIKLIKADSKSIKLSINDAKSGIGKYKAKLNGKWLLLKYDYKQKRLETDANDPNIPFSGELSIELTDNTGNKTDFKTKIK